MTPVHLAQVNIARSAAPLESEQMRSFVERIEEINALADRAAGFVWRLPSATTGDAYLRPYDDDRILFNLSVWESAEHLKDYVYKSAHAELLRKRREWFEHFTGAMLALWWIPVGHVPSVDEAKKRLAHLEELGPTPFAFTFKTMQAPDPALLEGFDWTVFTPCPASA
jgi:heme-degrading monooxygenase HmoA